MSSSAAPGDSLTMRADMSSARSVSVSGGDMLSGSSDMMSGLESVVSPNMEPEYVDGPMKR